MSDSISSSNPLTDGDQQTLRILAGLLIPADAEFGVPGADDGDIFDNLLALVLETEAGALDVKKHLDELNARAHLRNGATLTALGEPDQIALLSDSASTEAVQTLIYYTANAYYQDGRVLESVNMKSEPPFPGGNNDVDQGDWSLLDPVKERAPFWKRV